MFNKSNSKRSDITTNNENNINAKRVNLETSINKKNTALPEIPSINTDFLYNRHILTPLTKNKEINISDSSLPYESIQNLDSSLSSDPLQPSIRPSTTTNDYIDNTNVMAKENTQTYGNDKYRNTKQ